MIHFQAKTQVVQSEDPAGFITELAAREGLRRVGVIVDRNVAGLEKVRGLQQALAGKLKVEVEVVDPIEPTTDIVDEVTGRFRKRGQAPDLFVGIGGGSTLDLMKAVSVMTVNEGSVTEYHGTGKDIPKGVRKIAIPTTAGTGSEVTPGAVLVNPKTAFKRALGGPQVCSDYALLDATLTQSMPPGVAAATAMDALTHCIESYTAKCANPITRMYSKEAFGLVFNNLPRVFADPKDLDARRAVQLGSCLAGFAIFNSNTGACHAMAYPLGIYHHVPHGVAVALIIPKVLEINLAKGAVQYADLLDLVEPDARGDAKAKAKRFLERLKGFVAFEHLDPKLTRYGVTPKDVDFLAERGLDLKSALSNNPVEFTLDDAKAVLRQLV